MALLPSVMPSHHAGGWASFHAPPTPSSWPKTTPVVPASAPIVEGPRIMPSSASTPSKPQFSLNATPPHEMSTRDAHRDAYRDHRGNYVNSPFEEDIGIKLVTNPNHPRNPNSGDADSLVRPNKRSNSSGRGPPMSEADVMKAAMMHAQHAEELQREMAAREAKLHVLRAEVAAREEEVEQISVQARDANFKLLEASGNMDTLSVKVETVAGNRSSVLRASAKTSHVKADTLRHWLSDKFLELQAKDEEIAKLSALAKKDHDLVQYQQAAVQSMVQQTWTQGEQVSRLEEEERRIKRHHAIDQWAVSVKTKIDQESADVAIRRNRRAVEEQLLEVNEANGTLRAFVLRMQEKCRQLVSEYEATQKKHSALLMEERVHHSAAQAGQDCAGENLMAQQANFSDLQKQMANESHRKHAARNKAKQYDEKESVLQQHQTELMGLTACLREVKRILADPAASDSTDAIDLAINEEVVSQQDFGLTVPPLLRIGPSEYLVGSELVQCVMRGGSLFVRPPAMASIGTAAASVASTKGKLSPRTAQRLPSSQEMIPIGEFLRSRALRNEHERSPGFASPRFPGMSPMPMSRRTSPTSALPTFKRPLLGQPQAAKHLVGLVSPLMIGGASPITA